MASVGSLHVTSVDAVSRQRAVNLFSFGTALVLLGYAPVALRLGGSQALALSNLVLVPLLLLPVRLNAKGRRRTATGLLMLLGNLVTLAYALVLGNATGIYLGFLVWSAAATLFVRPSARLRLTLARVLPIALLALSYVIGTLHGPLVALPPQVQQTLYALQLATTALLVVLIMSAYDAASRCVARELSASHERTERALDRALRESEGRFTLLVRQAGDALLVVTEDGRVVHANAQAEADLGHDPTGRWIWEVDTTLTRGVLRPLVHTLLEGTHYRAEHTYVRADGSTFAADVRAGAITTAGGRQLLISARDMTEQRELHSQLISAERMASIGTLAAGVAHEINNPLGYVHMHVEMLSRRLTPHLQAMSAKEAAALRRSLTRAREGIERVQRIVGDLMSFARGDDGEVGTAHVAEVLERTLQLAEPDLGRQVRVITCFDPAPPARGSASRLGQVFLNLVANARQALAAADIEEPTLQVRVRYCSGPHLHVEIEDNGPGMGAEVAARVFEPFFTTKEADRGTGLGLFVCRNLISQLGGDIELSSEPGKGSCFRVRLPVAFNPAASDSDGPHTSGVHRSVGLRAGSAQPKTPGARRATSAD